MKNPYKTEPHRLAFDQAVQIYRSGVTDSLQISKQLDHSIQREMRRKIAAKVRRLFYWQEQKTEGKIMPHKGGRTVKKSTDVSPDVSNMLAYLWREHHISLGDIIEDAVIAKYIELSPKVTPQAP